MARPTRPRGRRHDRVERGPARRSGRGRATHPRHAPPVRLPGRQPACPAERPDRPGGGPAGPSAHLGVADHGQRRRRRARRAGWRDRPGGAGPVGGDRALRRDRTRGGRRAARGVAPRGSRLGRLLGGRRCPGRASAGRPRPAGRARAPADVPGERGRATARGAPQRPAPGSGRSAPAGGGGVHRDHLRAVVAVPPAGGRDPRDRRATRPGGAAGCVRARPGPGPRDAHRRR